MLSRRSKLELRRSWTEQDSTHGSNEFFALTCVPTTDVVRAHVAAL